MKDFFVECHETWHAVAHEKCNMSWQIDEVLELAWKHVESLSMYRVAFVAAPFF